MHQNTGFAAASARQNQNTSAGTRDCLPLGGVQRLKDGGNVHASILQRSRRLAPEYGSKDNQQVSNIHIFARSCVMSFDVKRMLKPELNIGLSERKTRFGVGIAALLVSVFLANIPLLLLGTILVTTAKVRWCPVYSGLGKSTVKPGEEALQSVSSAEHH
jgi:hypothetical protein